MDFNVGVTDKEIDDELFKHRPVRADLTTEELASLREEMIWKKAGGDVLDGVLWLGGLSELSRKRRYGQLGLMSKDQSELRSIIERCLWMPEKTEYQTFLEYIEKDSCGLTASEFLFFSDTCYYHGTMEKTDSSVHQYFYFDDYRYWMTIEPIKEVSVIYRQKAPPQKR